MQEFIQCECLHHTSKNTVHYRCVGEFLSSLFQMSTVEYGNVRSITVAYVSWNTRNRKIGIFDSQILTVSSRRRSRLHIVVAKTLASCGEESAEPRTVTT